MAKITLREARFHRRLTQWQIARITQISQAKLSLVENGFVVLNLNEREAVAGALGYPVDSIDWWIQPEGLPT